MRVACLLLVLLFACVLGQEGVPARCRHATDTTQGVTLTLWGAERKLGKAGKEYDVAPDLICRNCAGDENLSPDLLYGASCEYAPKGGWACIPEFKGEGAETAGWSNLELGCMACDVEHEHLIYPQSCSLRYDLHPHSLRLPFVPVQFEAYAYTALRKSAGGRASPGTPFATLATFLVLLFVAALLGRLAMRRPSLGGKANSAPSRNQRKQE